MLSQAHISPTTPMGADLVDGGGATFRVWAPRATAVYVNGVFAGTPKNGQTADLLMVKAGNGYWTGFLADAGEASSAIHTRAKWLWINRSRTVVA
jgi:1,4-alpha-glucan branching enzyme